MGTFDAAKVIEAAATSNLGVVSLIVLVLAFLAWRLFQRSNDRVKLVAFAMMFLGAAGFVSAAMLAGDGGAGVGTPVVQPKQAASSASGSPGAGVTVGAAEPIDIAGEWRDGDGYRFTIAQSGGAFTYRAYLDDALVGTGAGTIAGTRLTYRFIDNEDRSEGDCEADVAADRRTIRGTCRDGADSWNFAIER